MADSLIKRGFIKGTEAIDLRFGWNNLPKPLALLTLIGLRMNLRRHNLFDAEGVTLPWGPAPLPAGPRSLVRATDGTGNDLTDPKMGSAGARFGRNVPPDETYPTDVLTPNPRLVSRELLTREQFQPATSLNLMAASWLQFEVHDWFSHGTNDPNEPWQVELTEDDPWPDHPMQIQRTTRDTSTTDGGPPTYSNTETHWWDASQVYGSTPDLQHLIRTHVGGKVLLTPDGSGALRPNHHAGPGRRQRQLVGRPAHAAHPVHPRAQRHLRRPRRRLPVLVGRGAVPARPAGDRRPDRQDPHGRVDARRHRPPETRLAMRANWWGSRASGCSGGSAGSARARSSAASPARDVEDYGVPYA